MGRQRILRRLATVNVLVGFQFTTVSGLGKTAMTSGEGSISTDALSGAIILEDTLGNMNRFLKPSLRLDKNALHFNRSLVKNRLFIINDGDGLAIVDSVKLTDESRFYSQPYYHGLGYANTIFSKGPFLVFPKDSIFLDIFLRDSTMNQALNDTFQVFATDVNGEKLPKICIPVNFDPTVSVRDPSYNLDQIPQSYQLNTYPNPVINNQDLHITFRLSEPEHIKIQIYDLVGREIVTLINQKMLTGEHLFVWNTQNLVTGTYFVRLKTSQRIEFTKIKIIK